MERSGSDPNANVNLVVSDGGSVTCNGKQHPLDADRLLAARQLERDLEPQAELGIQLPQGSNGELAYKVRMEAGSLAFGDESPQIPQDLPPPRRVHQRRDRARLRHPAMSVRAAVGSRAWT